MKKPLFDSKWMRVGFNLGIGMSLAFAVCYFILMGGVFGIVAIFGTAKIVGPGLFSFSVSILAVLAILLLLVFIPAFVGKTIAQTINYFRFRKITSMPAIKE